MWKYLESEFKTSDRSVLRRGRPAGWRAIAGGPRPTFGKTVTRRVQSLAASAARWRDLLPHQRFERGQMGSRRVNAARPIGRDGGHGRADVVDLAAYRDHVYPHGQYRNGAEPGHS